ncbi:Hypothetical protein R9X50_00339400 [Acrodontium crateriforme]|uniref:Guanine nucleotide exchange factor LTE1 n=1 Tax=Acrodontium crateriforme TaxID=150365 RepID=A0AAQ3M3A9_9PEZI|nr:Hypothetical protein R9X50_00339400 [Acrodontium crateriforme]
MEQGPVSPKRDQPTSPDRSPIRIPREKKGSPERSRPTAQPTQGGKIKAEKDSGESITVPRRALGNLGHALNARQFTVANVGAGGTLYLKPTPINSGGNGWKSTVGDPGRQIAPSVSSKPRQSQAPRRRSIDPGVPAPPVSLNNVNQRRRPRSHSFSTLTDHARSTFRDSASSLQILLNGRETITQRAKSSMDLSAGLLDFDIPNYQLGTPRFSEHGTAYLTNSIYISNSDDAQSAVSVAKGYDQLFPVPPGRPSRILSHLSHVSSASPFLHPSMASQIKSNRQSTASFKSAANSFTALFDQIEANANDTSCVRFNPDTGRISAATPSRLIAQITSPHFLDYELLSDFFLTYRIFLSPHDLLEFLLGRLRWALTSSNDSGRIVRVRTFVALRHWILNYFSDDFTADYDLRIRFCDLVNDLTRQLRSRPNEVGTDLNIVGELKKCWRRTCAVVWPGHPYGDHSIESDLYPSGEPASSHSRAETAHSAPPEVPDHSNMDNDRISQRFNGRGSHQVKWSDDQGVGTRTSRPETDVMTFRTASIPTSPMSEQSLTVLSCSVPFLRNMMATARSGEKAIAKTFGSHKKAPSYNEKAGHPSNLHQHKPSISHQHKRSGSFSDALRDKRSPLPSAKVNNLDLQSLPVIAFTGGLVRGLLLQPSPAEVVIPVPLSPVLSPHIYVASGSDADHSKYRPSQTGSVKRIVGDVRRAISGRKIDLDFHSSSQQESKEKELGSHHSRQSSNASKPSQPTHKSKLSNVSISSPVHGFHRIDTLGAQIQASYKAVYEQASPSLPHEGRFESKIPEARKFEEDTKIARPLGRWNSHLTTGSRSIVIVDDTGILPTIRDSPHDFLILDPEKLDYGEACQEDYASRALPDVPDNDEKLSEWRRLSDNPIRELLVGPSHVWEEGLIKETDGETMSVPAVNARKSSTANPVGLVDISHIRGQLRRRPGGDLKAADHVHELESTTRDSTNSFSTGTPTPSLRDSVTASHDRVPSFNLPISETGSWPLRSGRVRGRKHDSSNLVTAQSQPIAKASFEAQALKVASLLNNSQDGGIEDALMKLEGRSQEGSVVGDPNPGVGADETAIIDKASTIKFNRRSPVRVISNGGQAGSLTASSDLVSEDSQYHRDSTPTLKNLRLDTTLEEPEEYVRLESMTSCTDSFDDMAPVLPRGSKISKFPIHNQDADELSSLLAVDPMKSADEKDSDTQRALSSKLSIPSTSARSHGDSFLLDDNESLSDISTEMADVPDDASGLGMRSFFFDDTPEDDETRKIKAPLTPPQPGRSACRSPDRYYALPQNPSPLTNHSSIDFSSSKKNRNRHHSILDHDLMVQPVDMGRITSPTPSISSHLPFVLAFDAETIAQQLTIIEKDAIDEVDWKDLIGMHWEQSPPPVRNWVDQLQNEDCNGIDIVVARFNLVVKWVISECVLTESLNERARCITKFIHIASTCHRLRNYASMYQITLALLSSDLARLEKTWAIIPLAEKQDLERLERLCQPLRNFANLRAEMETSNTDAGCIPFIGLYTHDLTYNAQKPAWLDASPPANEPLINFERYQTAATIIKSLLRLIEASSRYEFHPHPVALSRCLWLAALDDKEITALSRRLER